MRVMIVGSGDIAKAIAAAISDHEIFHSDKLRGQILEESIRQVGASIMSTRPDVIINTVGSFAFDDEVIDQRYFFDINFHFAFRLSDKDNWKYIFHITSDSAHIPRTNSALYCSSKAAVSMMIKCLARKWGKDKVCVSEIAPGAVDGTRMCGHIISRVGDFSERTFIGRLVSPEEVGRLVSFLLNQGPSVNGQQYILNGGWK